MDGSLLGQKRVISVLSLFNILSPFCIWSNKLEKIQLVVRLVRQFQFILFSLNLNCINKFKLSLPTDQRVC